MSLTRKLKKSDEKPNEVITPKTFNIVLTPEKQVELSDFCDRNVPGMFARMFAEFLNRCPVEEVKPKT